MKLLIHSSIKLPDAIESIYFCSSIYRDTIIASILSDKEPILASISARDITKSMVRTKSSNIWSYTINVKSQGDTAGDVYVQFKGPRGGPGDVYVLYDVPIKVYKQFISAPSKGHAYWKLLRNNYYYSKLTGDKKGKLKNAINH